MSVHAEELFVVFGDVERVRNSEVVVFDVDGVLIDSEERFRCCLQMVKPGAQSINDLSREERERFWRIFLSPQFLHMDKPVERVIEILREWREKEVPVVIITGRTEEMAWETIEQLRGVGADFDLIVFRRSGVKLRDAEFKRVVVEKLGLRILELHEDSHRVAEALKPFVRGRIFLWRPGGEVVEVG